MTPDVSRRSSRRRKAFESVHNMTSLIPLKKSRRAEIDNIEGVEVYSFEDELHIEYFTNLDEPLPRRGRDFRGFGDQDESVNLMKHYFDRFNENFLTEIELVDLFKKNAPKKIVPNRKTKTKKSKKALSFSNMLLHDVSNDGSNYGDVEEKWGHTGIEVKEFKDMDTEQSYVNDVEGADDSAVKGMPINVEKSDDDDSLQDEPAVNDELKAQDDSIELVNNPIEMITISEKSDDDDSLQDEPAVNDELKAQDDSIELVNNPIEIITISDNDSDDDCMMVGDPNAPIPRPVAVASDPTSCCPTCGKYKGAARRSESDKDSAIGDEISIMTDGDDTMGEADLSLPADQNPKQCDSSSRPPADVLEAVKSAPLPTVFKHRPATKSSSPFLHQPAPKPAKAETSTIYCQTPSSSPAGAASSLVPSVPSGRSVQNESLLPRIIKKRISMVESDPSLMGHTQTTRTNPAAEVLPTKNRPAFAKHDIIQTSPSVANVPSTSVMSAGATTPVIPSLKNRASANTPWQVKSNLPSAYDPKHSEATTPTKILKQSTLERAGALTPAFGVSAKSSGKRPSMESKVHRESSSPSGNRFSCLDRVAPVKRLPAEDLTDPEPPKPANNQPQNQPTNLKSPATPVPGSVKVRSESGKTVVLRLDGAKSQIIPQRPSTENPAPLKTYSKSTKNPHFVHNIRENKKQCDDPSMKPAKAKPPASHVPHSAVLKNPDIEPPQSKNLGLTREEIVSPKITTSPIVYRISDGKNTQLLKIVCAPKTQKAGVSTVQKPQPVTDLKAPKNNSDANDWSVDSSLPKATVAPHEPSANDRKSESTASKPVMAPFEAINSGSQQVFQVSITPRCSVTSPGSTQRSEPPVMPNNAVVLDHPSANTTKQSVSTASKPVFQILIPPRYSVTSPGSTQRSEPPVMPDNSVVLDHLRTNSTALKPVISPFKTITSGPKPVFQVTIPPRCNDSIPVSTPRSGAPAFVRLEKPGSVSVPTLLQKSLALSNGSKPHGCRVLKVVKPAQAPTVAASSLHPGVKVLRPVSAFRNTMTSSSDVSVKSIVRDMVDFVCQKERFPTSFPYDSPMKPETPCLTIPCGKERCRLGCLCVSLSKKSVRRARCKKLQCIFGCRCDMRNPAGVQSRHATPLILRRKQILGSCYNSTIPEAQTRSTLNKVPKFVSSLQEELNNSITFLKAPKAYSSLLDEPIHSSTPPKTPKVKCTLSKALKLCSAIPKPICSTISNPPPPSLCSTLPESAKVNLTPADLPAPTPRRYFGREKVPIPEQALICLTPGVGYVPLEEVSSTKVTVRDPFHSGKTKGFLNIRQATEWLNFTIQSLLSDSGTSLRWVVANKTMIESKQLHRLNMETLKSTKGTPTRNGTICAL